MKYALLFIAAALLIFSGCAIVPLFQLTPTLTSTPTVTSAPTETRLPTPSATSEPTEPRLPMPVITPTPDLLAIYSSIMPQIPPGFEWKIMPERDLAVLIPDGWFFKEETSIEQKLEAVYVTKENIDEVGRFSTGLTVLIFDNFKDVQEAEQFAIDMLVFHTRKDTTKDILQSYEDKSGSSVIRHLRIRGEYPEETEVNRNKIVHYTTIVANNAVYWGVFESPEKQWDQTIEEYGLVLEYLCVFTD